MTHELKLGSQKYEHAKGVGHPVIVTVQKNVAHVHGLFIKNTSTNFLILKKFLAHWASRMLTTDRKISKATHSEAILG